MTSTIAIAIDGPAGAGKSTIAKKIADRLSILYLDTGAMYRACGLKASRLGLRPDQVSEIEAMLQETNVDVRFVDGVQHVFLDDEDVNDKIRTPEISVWASDISAIPACRLKMVEAQRAIAARRSVVMDGRDIGSYVLPDAPVKIFLTADIDERARRRHLELQQRGDTQTTLQAVKDDLAYRDHQDSTRAFAPLVCVPDAHRLDTTDLNIDQSVAAVLDIIDKMGLDTGARG